MTLRFLTTTQEVTDASEPFIGSYGSKWRIQPRAMFSGRATSGTDRLYQTTFIGDLSDVAAEIMRVCVLRPKLTCTNMKGPSADIVKALADIGVHYDVESMRLTGEPVVAVSAPQSAAEQLAALQAETLALAAKQAEIASRQVEISAQVKAERDAKRAALLAQLAEIDGTVTTDEPTVVVETPISRDEGKVALRNRG